MRFAVIGGDRRAALLAQQLLRDGHRVHSFALEKAALPKEVPRDSCLQAAVYGADCVILPVPSETGGVLNTPLSDAALPMGELLGALWPGQLLCGGKLSDESCRLAMQGKLRVEDLLRRPDFPVGNAALTAEGALGLLIGAGDRALWDGRVLLCGFGRIARLLLPRLLALGASVTVAARSPADRAMARALGAGAAEFPVLEAEIGDFDFIVNTVPARVLSEAALCCVSPEAVLLELASPPGGFDRNLAENIGLQVLAAPGLPGKCAPYAAAALLRQAVYAALAEQED